MTRENRIILNLRMNKLLVVFVLVLFSMSSCHVKQDRLKTIIYDRDLYYDDIILPLMISTSDSLIRLICTTKVSILSELETMYERCTAEKILYNKILLKQPIDVSLEYYNSCNNDFIYMNRNVYMAFENYNIYDFVNLYFKNINGTLVLYESEEMFPVKGKQRYMGFGDKTNIELISYLLSMYDIYLQYIWLDEDCITRIVIAENVSDMSLLE
jgi:hypothetical protein